MDLALVIAAFRLRLKCHTGTSRVGTFSVLDLRYAKGIDEIMTYKQLSGFNLEQDAEGIACLTRSMITCLGLRKHL